MINVTIYKKSGQYAGIKVSGHAGYAESGYDIICAAVSVMTINCSNSIEKFTTDKFKLIEDEENAVIEIKFDNILSSQANLLLDSYVLGIEAILEENEQYIELNYKEV